MLQEKACFDCLQFPPETKVDVEEILTLGFFFVCSAWTLERQLRSADMMGSKKEVLTSTDWYKCLLGQCRRMVAVVRKMAKTLELGKAGSRFSPLQSRSKSHRFETCFSK